jgi:hypothetical protein
MRRPVPSVQFRTFVEATGYVAAAEKPVDWGELQKQVPPGTPKPPDEMLMPAALVFAPPSHAVSTRPPRQMHCAASSKEARFCVSRVIARATVQRPDEARRTTRALVTWAFAA